MWQSNIDHNSCAAKDTLHTHIPHILHKRYPKKKAVAVFFNYIEISDSKWTTDFRKRRSSEWSLNISKRNVDGVRQVNSETTLVCVCVRCAL